MNITAAQYYKAVPDGTENIGILATINGEDFIVPLDPNNADFAEVQKQVAAGELTIEEAD
jgi:hypothetical protein